VQAISLGDDYHCLWIDPADSRRMIVAEVAKVQKASRLLETSHAGLIDPQIGRASRPSTPASASRVRQRRALLAREVAANERRPGAPPP
jgi:hypothetical protein